VSEHIKRSLGGSLLLLATASAVLVVHLLYSTEEFSEVGIVVILSFAVMLTPVWIVVGACVALAAQLLIGWGSQ
jgi:hypothetical protein